MESLDSRLKRIEQRLSSIEKFIAENVGPKKKNDYSINLGRTSEPVEVSKEYHYDYSVEINSGTQVKAQFHQVDSSIFNEGPKRVINDDSMAVIAGGALVVFLLYFLGKFLLGATWLGATTQLALAAGVCVAFIGAGYILKDLGQLFVRYLPVLGLVGLYVCVYGASNYYNIIPKNVALIALLGVSVLGVFLSSEFRLTVYQIVAALGGYIAPLYVSFNQDLAFTNFYYLILSLLFLVGAVWLQMLPAAILGAFLSLFICGISDYVDQDVMNKVLFTSGHFVIFASAYVLHALYSKDKISKFFTYSFSLFILSFYVVQYHYISSIGRNPVLIFCAAMILLVSLAYVVVKYGTLAERTQLTADLMFSVQIALVSHALFYVVMPPRLRAVAVVVAAVAYFKSYPFWGASYESLKKLLTYLALIVVGVNALEVIINQFTIENKMILINGAVYAVVLFYVLFFEKTLGHLNVKTKATAGIAYIFALAVLYAATAQMEALVHLSAVGAGFVLALGHFVYLFKADQKTEA